MLMIHLTNECNLNCIFCNRPPGKTHVSKKEAERKIILHKKEKMVAFTGGEPTLRKDLPHLINFAKKNSYVRAEIVSNGMMFYYEAYLKKLINCGLDKVSVSLNTHKEKVGEKICRRRHVTKIKKRALDNLNKYNVPVLINTVINSYNINHLKELTQTITKQFPNVFMFNFLLVNCYGNALNHPECLISLQEAEPHLYELMGYCENNKIQFTVEFVPFCYMQGFEKHIQMCTLESEEIDKLKDYSFKGEYHNVGESVKKSREAQRLFIKGPQCKRCTKEEICPGVRDHYYKRFGTRELKPT
ncbi:MAG: radical SAM protein [Candidatus Nanoarchaeia archaeon]